MSKKKMRTKQQTRVPHPVEHVFVLMLENRSFDHMLGFSGLAGVDAVTGGRTSIYGLTSAESNSYQGVEYPVTKPADWIMPVDPGHEFLDVLIQLCGASAAYPPGGPYPAINNSGYVSDYAHSPSQGEGNAPNDFGRIMKCFDAQTQLPVLWTLASNFAVCDHWYSSMPGPTWPNRFFVHGASSSGLDHSPSAAQIATWDTVSGFSFKNGSVFDALDESKNNQTWRIYRGRSKPFSGSIPNVAALKGIHFWDTQSYDDFADDLKAGGYSPSYTFIEPNYGNVINMDFSGGQSQHPSDDVRNGEQLIKDTYEAIRNSDIWNNSLLIIIWDEHGGFFDHMTPPNAAPPGDTKVGAPLNQYGFAFDHYGPRVPAVVISPLIPAQTIDHRTYDHASIPGTLERLWNLAPLTNRDKAANSVSTLLSLAEPRTDAPSILPNPVPIPVAQARAKVKPLNLKSLPIDGGNLPGVLYVALRAELHLAQVKERQAIARAFKSIKTRADAQAYLEGLENKFGAEMQRRSKAKQR